MALERILRTLQGIGILPTPSRQLKPSEVIIPFPIQRADILTNLLTKQGNLTSSQIEAIANELYQDTLEGRARKLGDIYSAAGLRGNFGYSAFLDHVYPLYTKKEMEQEDSLRPVNPHDISYQPRTLADHLSGSGPKRPLLMELYAGTISTGNVRAKPSNTVGKEIFSTGSSANLYVDGIDRLFINREDYLKRHQILMLVGQSKIAVMQGQEIIARVPTTHSQLY